MLKLSLCSISHAVLSTDAGIIEDTGVMCHLLGPVLNSDNECLVSLACTST